MPSNAAIRSGISFERADVLRDAAGRIRGAARSEHVQTFYHASLALGVAAWDAYLNEVATEFFAVVGDPLQPKFDAMTRLSQRFSELALKHFNTPNFEKSRELLVNCTGYDPYNDWSWPQRSMNVLQVQERLNQILKVRHSFAHGFPMPAYQWTQGRSGRVRLTSEGVDQTVALLKRLVVNTDRGLKAHITSTYGINLIW